MTNHSSKFYDFETGRETGKGDEEKKQTLSQSLPSQSTKTTVDDNEGVAVVAKMYQLSRLDSNGTNKTISGITDVITDLDVKENQTNVTFTSGKDIDNVDGHTLDFSNLTEITSRVANRNASDLQNKTTFEAKTNENTVKANESVTLDEKSLKLTINEVENNNDSDLRSNATLEPNHGASVIDNYHYYYDDNLDGNNSKGITREAAIKSQTDLNINATSNQKSTSQSSKTTADDNEGIAIVAEMYQLSRSDSNGTNKTISGITDLITDLDVKENQTNITFTSGKDIDNVDGHTLNFSNLNEIASRLANIKASDLQNHTTFDAKTNENTVNANENVTLDDKNRKLTINEVENKNDSDLRSKATLEPSHGASVIDNYHYYYDDNLDSNNSKGMTRETAIKSQTDLHINATSKPNANESTVNKNGHRLLNKDYCNTALYGEEHTMCKYKENRPNDRCRKGGAEIIFPKITDQVNRSMNIC